MLSCLCSHNTHRRCYYVSPRVHSSLHQPSFLLPPRIRRISHSHVCLAHSSQAACRQGQLWLDPQNTIKSELKSLLDTLWFCVCNSIVQFSMVSFMNDNVTSPHPKVRHPEEGTNCPDVSWHNTSCFVCQQTRGPELLEPTVVHGSHS